MGNDQATAVDSHDGIASGSASTPRPIPRKWWQWVLVYPTLAVSLLGAIPTLKEAFTSWKLGVPFGMSYDALEQNRLWQENFECLKGAEFSKIVNHKKIEIGSKVCETGDILLSGKRPEWERPKMRWVSWNTVASNQPDAKAELEIIRSAHAGSFSMQAAYGQMYIICQRWVGPGLLLQRVQAPMGCYDQVINTYTGMIVGQSPAPCVPC